MGVSAPNFINSDPEDEDYPLKASDLRDLQRPAKPLFQSETDLDATVISNEDSEPEEYHMVTGANRQLHRQSFQNPNL